MSSSPLTPRTPTTPRTPATPRTPTTPGTPQAPAKLRRNFSLKKLFSKADEIEPGPLNLAVPNSVVPKAEIAPNPTSQPPAPQVASPARRPKLSDVTESKSFSTLEEERPPAQQIPNDEHNRQSEETVAVGGALTKFKSLLNRESFIL